MPVFAIQVCLNVSQSIVCINKSRLYIVPMCPKLPPGWFTGVYVINSVTILIASIDMSKCLNIRYRKT